MLFRSHSDASAPDADEWDADDVCEVVRAAANFPQMVISSAALRAGYARLVEAAPTHVRGVRAHLVDLAEPGDFDALCTAAANASIAPSTPVSPASAAWTRVALAMFSSTISHTPAAASPHALRPLYCDSCMAPALALGSEALAKMTFGPPARSTDCR